MAIHRTQWKYVLAFTVIFIAEVLIALFVQDAFIRPYGGDILVTILLCCLVRIFFPHDGETLIPLSVFGFACLVEGGQAMGLVSLLHLDHIAFFRIVIGTSFSWIDVLCYAIGCVIFWLAEFIFRRKRRTQSR